jgi:hypothetical protein
MEKKKVTADKFVKDPIYYDLTINTGNMGMASAVEAVISAVMVRLRDAT